MGKNKKTKFNQVAAEIEKRIHEGIYVSSQKLPSEYDLAKEFDCSRLTIRKAIDDLITKKIIVKRRGKGSYVMLEPKIQSGRSGLQGFTEVAKTYGKNSSTEVISFQKISEPSEEILNVLQLKREQPIYELIRRRILDTEPMTVEKIYISEYYVKGLTKKDFTGSLFKLLEEKIDIAYSHQEVEAVLVQPELSKLLDIPLGDPLLQVHSVTYALNGKPIFYDISYYRSDRYVFKTTLTRNNH